MSPPHFHGIRVTFLQVRVAEIMSFHLMVLPKISFQVLGSQTNPGLPVQAQALTALSPNYTRSAHTHAHSEYAHYTHKHTYIYTHTDYTYTHPHTQTYYTHT